MENVRIMNKALINHLHRVGHAQVMVKEVLNRAIFETLSKHNQWWVPGNMEEAFEKLDYVRRTLNGIQMELWEIQGALSLPEDEV